MKLCLCMASLVERTRLAVHKQSFLNLQRQNGRGTTKGCSTNELRAVVIAVIDVKLRAILSLRSADVCPTTGNTSALRRLGYPEMSLQLEIRGLAGGFEGVRT